MGATVVCFDIAERVTAISSCNIPVITKLGVPNIPVTTNSMAISQDGIKGITEHTLTFWVIYLQLKVASRVADGAYLERRTHSAPR